MLEVRYTRLAKALLGDGRAAFEERLRGELSDLLKESGSETDPFTFHAITYNDRLFIAFGCGAYVGVDSATWYETEPLTNGPFKGRRLSVPQADSDLTELNSSD